MLFESVSRECDGVVGIRGCDEGSSIVRQHIHPYCFCVQRRVNLATKIIIMVKIGHLISFCYIPFVGVIDDDLCRDVDQ